MNEYYAHPRNNSLVLFYLFLYIFLGLVTSQIWRNLLYTKLVSRLYRDDPFSHLHQTRTCNLVAKDNSSLDGALVLHCFKTIGPFFQLEGLVDDALNLDLAAICFGESAIGLITTMEPGVQHIPR
jgi:hypothetical protein